MEPTVPEPADSSDETSSEEGEVAASTVDPVDSFIRSTDFNDSFVSINDGNGDDSFSSDQLVISDQDQFNLIARLIAIQAKHGQCDAELLSQCKLWADSLHDGPKIVPHTLYQLLKLFDKLAPVKGCYTVFCVECKTVFGKQLEKRPEGQVLCNNCNRDLAADMKRDTGLFITFSVKDQLKNYFERVDFCELLNNESYTKYGRIEFDLDDGSGADLYLWLSVFTDAAPLQNRGGITLYPILALVGNLLLPFQVKFPLMLGVYAGKANAKPPPMLLFQALRHELRNVGDVVFDVIDSGGNVRKIKFCLKLKHGDAPERASVMGHIGHAGKFACITCVAEGETIDGTVRYPNLVHEEPAPIRDNDCRVNPSSTLRDGITGKSALAFLPQFEDNDGHLADYMHVVPEGIGCFLKNRVTLHGKTKSYSLNDGTATRFEHIDEVVRKATIPSEVDHLLPSFTEAKHFKAIDNHNFLTVFVGPLLSDETSFRDRELYQVFVHLANAVYWLMYSRPDETVRTKIKLEVEAFAESFKNLFGSDRCTYKFHLFQHFPRYHEKYGPMYLWDSFTFERLLGIAKRKITTTRLRMEQCSRYFFIRYQCRLWKNRGRFSGKTAKALKQLGLVDDLVGHWTIKVIKASTIDCEPTDSVRRAVEEECLRRNVNSAVTVTCEILRLRFFNLELTSENTRCSGRTNDSFIQIDGVHYGQIKVMFEVTGGKYVIVLQKYSRDEEVLDRSLCPLRFPDNQFPVKRTSELYAVFLVKDILIQKVHVVPVRFQHEPFIVRTFFSIRPTEWWQWK